MKKINWGQFSVLTAFLFFVLADLLSFTAYVNPWVNTALFFVIILTTLIVGLKKPVFAVYMAFLELFIGSKGYLAYLDLGDFWLPIRMGIFAVIFAIWVIKFTQAYLIEYKTNHKIKSLPQGFLTIFKTQFGKFYLAIFGVMLWGLVWGFIRQNGISNIVFDFNAWLYFAMIIPAFDFVKTKLKLKSILNLLLGASLFLVIKTFYISYIYSHIYQTWMLILYRWMTDFGLGEISAYTLGFYRVFIQSQIFAIGAFFVSLTSILISKFKLSQKPKKYLWLVFIASGIVLLVSFSRSYWVGLLVGLVALFIILKFTFKFDWKQIAKTFGILIICLIVMITLTYGILNLPPKANEVDLTSALMSRFLQNGAAGQSRISQLKPLSLKITEHPIVGHGFGQTLTYQSFDPRQMTPKNPEGWYTTYAFEWGYLDMMLKFGIAGLIVYLALIFKLFKSAWLKTRQFISENKYSNAGILTAFSVSTLGLMGVHMFSPYLNHPLGIGFIILFNLAIFIL